jgi:hypothetical protein
MTFQFRFSSKFKKQYEKYLHDEKFLEKWEECATELLE